MAFLQGKAPWRTVSLTGGTAETVTGIQAAAEQVVKVLEIKMTHDGNTSGNAPDLTDFGRCTFGANAPGTNSTSTTVIKKDPGRAETVQTIAGHTWTTEPTTITVDEPYNLPQYNGAAHYITPFAAPEIVVGGQGYVVRQNSPNNVNSSGKVEFEE